MPVQRLHDLIPHDKLVALLDGYRAGIDELRQQIARLQAQVEELQGEAVVVERALAQQGDGRVNGPDATTGRVAGGSGAEGVESEGARLNGTALADAVRSAVRSQPADYLWKSGDLWGATSDVVAPAGLNRDSFYSVVYRLAKKGELIQVKKGLYQRGPRFPD